MMKSDVLDTFPVIKACTRYKVDGELTDRFPFDAATRKIEPVYTEIPGWQQDLSGMKNKEEFPDAFRNYISFLEEQLGVPITIVSVGPDREQTIELVN